MGLQKGNRLVCTAIDGRFQDLGMLVRNLADTKRLADGKRPVTIKLVGQLFAKIGQRF